MNHTTKVFRIITVLLWAAALICAVFGEPGAYRAFSAATAVSASVLIRSARKTQGHYANISQAYFAGCIIWAVTDILSIAAVMTGSDILQTAALNCSYLPDIFFSAGLLLFAQSEYNRLHFGRMTLHTFAIAFFAFMIVQKLVLVHWAGIRTSGIEMLGAMTYFFIAVFTIVLVIAIFVQTGFKGHTPGTNLSAVILVIYNLIELDRMYCRLSDTPPRGLMMEMVGLLGLVIYSWAQSDPQLEHRETEGDELKPGERVKNIYIWGNSAVFMALGIALYAAGLFDTRDLYFLIIAVLAYATVFKSIQARVYNRQLLNQQLRENQRLEEMVEEKTRELREANEHLQLISTTDALTGLYNRRYGKELLASLSSDKDGGAFAFMLMDLNRFKQVNDVHGHEAGDEVLKEVGARLKSLAGEDVTAIRLGGDEFLVVVKEKEGEPMRDTASRLADAICTVMDQPIDTGAGRLGVSACIGIGLWPEHSDDPDELYQIADEAMYGIKHKKEESSYSMADIK